MTARLIISYHPNIDRLGRICMDTLKSKDAILEVLTQVHGVQLYRSGQFYYRSKHF